MNIDNRALTSKLSKELLKSVTRTVLLVSVMFLAHLATLLPGMDDVTSVFGIDGGVVMGAVLTTVVVGLLVYLSAVLRRLIEVVLSGPAVIVDHAALSVRWVIALRLYLVLDPTARYVTDKVTDRTH